MTLVKRGHPVAWMIWAASAASAALLVRHPVYLAVIGLAGAAVAARLGEATLDRRAMRWIAGLLLFPAGINMFLSRAGETVLLKLPIGWIGGPYTLEAFFFGLTAGVQITALLAVMLALQRAVEPTDILRRMPSALYPIGVSAAIGLSFTRRAQKAVASVREAQLVRGHKPRGWRDFPAWASPLVILSLENAQDVAEGMVARGWPEASASPGLAGIPDWPEEPRDKGQGAVATRARVSRYRPEAWTRRETWMVGISLGAALAIGFLSVAAPGLLVYSPYPRAGWPEVHAAIVAAAALLAIPRSVASGEWRVARDHDQAVRDE